MISAHSINYHGKHTFVSAIWNNAHTPKHRILLNNFSTTTAGDAPPKNDGHTKKEGGNKKEKDTSDLFFDNVGKIFMASLVLVISWLIRSSKSGGNQTQLREDIENRTALDPLEIDDLREANEPHFNVELFQTLQKVVLESFPRRVCKYEDFVSVVMKEMKGMGRGDEFTIQFGHLLDRVVIAVLEGKSDRRNTSSSSSSFGNEGVANDAELPVSFFLSLLTLCVTASVSEKYDLLFSILRANNTTNTNEEHNRNDEREQHHEGTGDVDSSKITLSEQDIIKMVGHLQDTCQLPPGPQVLEAETKYPLQEYKRGSAAELVKLGKVELFGEKSKKLEDGDLRYGREDFENLLRTSYICVWGECYNPKPVIREDAT
eukprot:CAMPEP_0195514276 /NCGR_PEP_ID=MMETSP0794_2-20130614/5712_1 /TAXON_ID=515487 /ORGANISM="Stephanopyxis turris, Strain CCMP 815" /LENGTH=373 /DNA_ID=CAMNT_0040642483 /DNA_START=204 /DNA_END=1325 /DNA_ORIENTATION=+